MLIRAGRFAIGRDADAHAVGRGDGKADRYRDAAETHVYAGADLDSPTDFHPNPDSKAHADRNADTRLQLRVVQRSHVRAS